ncbi:MAG: hypothetical protein HYV37_02145 [Candidatus Levyibacteriota bacterium]|nr:MAG: hypothetical protein HYV37_02145 [Candidatus Levybacteria bacterium]
MKFIILFFIFLCFIFFRFYDIGRINQFGWDQVDNAWAAKNIIIDHKLPLVGMPVKGSSGFYIGPAYYYLISVFYFFTMLDPIASGLFVGFTSIFTFWIFYFVTKKIFSTVVAFLAVFIYTFSWPLIQADRIQWPVNFIAPISFIVFFALYKIITGKEKYLLLLATAFGFSLHIHFTSIFYFIIVLLALPFFPWKKTIWKYALIAIPLFLIWLIPNAIFEFNTKAASGKSLTTYISTYYHGFHARRFLQLLPDAFIKFESVLTFRMIKPLSYILLPIFYFLYYSEVRSNQRLKLCYLILLWFLVPWVIFSTYSGEISDYYFFLTMPIVIIVLSYITSRVFQINNMLPKIAIVIFWSYYALFSAQNFAQYPSAGLAKSRVNVTEAIKQGRVIEFVHGSADSYLYYIYTRNKK